MKKRSLAVLLLSLLCLWVFITLANIFLGVTSSFAAALNPLELVGGITFTLCWSLGFSKLFAGIITGVVLLCVWWSIYVLILLAVNSRERRREKRAHQKFLDEHFPKDQFPRQPLP